MLVFFPERTGIGDQIGQLFGPRHRLDTVSFHDRAGNALGETLLAEGFQHPGNIFRFRFQQPFRG
ncbi:hypothetical protein D3C79_908690 [compost metagenome]